MSKNLLKDVAGRVLVCDGAMGTELMKRGLEPGSCPEAWNVDRPDDVRAIHKAYRDAGADVILTNTFGGNRWKLDAYGLAGRVAELNAAAVRLARKVAGRAGYVFGDIGPTGRFVAPLGLDPREAFVEVFREQANALAAAGADAIILETFTAVDELAAAVEAARSTGLPVAASMSFSRDAAGTFHTMMGVDIPSAVRALDAAGVDIVAANCGTGAEDYPDIARALCAATSRPVMVEPNAGLPQLVDGKTVFPMSAQEMARYAREILAAGVRIIGGCCGTTPEHIRAIRRVVDESRPRR